MWRTSPRLLQTTVDLNVIEDEIAEEETELLLKVGIDAGKLDENAALRECAQIDQVRAKLRDECQWLVDQLHGNRHPCWEELKQVSVRDRCQLTPVMDLIVLATLKKIADTFVLPLREEDPTLYCEVFDEVLAEETRKTSDLNLHVELVGNDPARIAFRKNIEKIRKQSAAEDNLAGYVKDELAKEWQVATL